MDDLTAGPPDPGRPPVSEQTGASTPVPPEPQAAATASPGDAAAPGPPGRRRRKRRRWVVALASVLGVIVILVIAAFVTAHFTSASSFCDSCHEMEPYYSSWQSSSHAMAGCSDCHIPPGVVPYIETKLGSFREIWVHITGNPEAPLAVTREIPRTSCTRCHEEPPPDPSLPTTTFSHEAHSDERCIDCHVRVVHRDLAPGYQDPAAMSSCLECHDGATAANNCSYCHTQPHEARGECSNCHNMVSWEQGTKQHPVPLEGAHAKLVCKDCHVSGPGVENIPGTSLGKADPACSSCHADWHGGLTDCGSCHTPTQWTNVSFEHPFPLTGGHAGVACSQCHVQKPGGPTVPGTQFPLPDPACVSCHEDQHGGLTDCGSCHTPTEWTNAALKHPFPLTDSHAGLACDQCHVAKPGGATVPGTQFPLPDPECISCHGDKHGGLTDCSRCHTPTQWSKVKFKHPFALRGAHARLACNQCHVPGGKVIPGTKFPAASKTCSGCHGTKHGGLTNCGRCHTTSAWKPSTFRHPGVGEEHTWRSFACSRCHPNGYASHSCTCHGGDPPNDD